MRVVHATYIVAAWYENPSVVGRLPLEKQTKESVRRDKRPSSVYCMAQKHLLVGASLSTVCWFIFVSICWSIFLNSWWPIFVSICWSTFLNSCWPIFVSSCRSSFVNSCWPISVSICWSIFLNSCWAICYESYHLLVRLLVT